MIPQLETGENILFSRIPTNAPSSVFAFAVTPPPQGNYHSLDGGNPHVPVSWQKTALHCFSRNELVPLCTVCIKLECVRSRDRRESISRRQRDWSMWRTEMSCAWERWKRDQRDGSVEAGRGSALTRLVNMLTSSLLPCLRWQLESCVHIACVESSGFDSSTWPPAGSPPWMSSMKRFSVLLPEGQNLFRTRAGRTTEGVLQARTEQMSSPAHF